MIALNAVFLREVAVDAEQIDNGLWRVGRDFGRRLIAIEVRGAQNIKDQQAVVGNDRPARLGDDGRMGDADLVADALDAKNDVVGVFLQRVINGRREIGLGAVVIDAEAAADIDIFHGRAHANQLRVDPSDLGEGILDATDVRDLAAQVEMNELQAIFHAASFEILVSLQDFRQCQAKFRTEAGTVFPSAGPARGQLDADAYHRTHLGFLSEFNDQLQLGKLLHNRDDILADLTGEHSHLNKLVILEAVADNGRLHAVGQGQHCQ